MKKLEEAIALLEATATKYPELDKIAKSVASKVGDEINHMVKNVKSDMPYKAQYVLEEVIKILQDAV